MTTTDKVQVGDSTIGTSTSTNYWTNPSYQSEKGWECPRCKRINAPWVRQCDCSGNNWTITSDWTYKPDWWKEVTCQGTKTVPDSDTFKVHPNSTIYQVGGSDYWNPHTKTYENIPTHISNKIEPNSVTTAWNCTNPDNCYTPHYTTKTCPNNICENH